MGHRHERHAHAGHAPDLRGEHAAGVDHDVGLDVAALGAHPAHAPVAHVEPGHARVRVDVAAALARALGERVGEQARVEVAVGRQPRRAEHAVGGHEREALLRLLRAQQLERQPERLGPARLAPGLLPTRFRRREPQPAALDPAAVERPVELDRVHHHPRQRHRAAQLPDEPGRVERRAGGELVAVDQHDVVPAELGEVVGDRAAAHAPADDHAARGPRKVTRHAGRPRARRRSAGQRTRPGRARSAPGRTRRSRSRAPRSRSARRPTWPRAGPT